MWAVTCDPGIDDAVALAVAAGEADLTLTAVVAGAGNVSSGTGWRNAVGMVALLGLDVPVGIGSETALDGTPISRGPSAHGADGLGGLALRLPLHTGAPRAGAPLVRGGVIATATLTDVARALRSGAPVEHVVWMGGSVGCARDVDPIGAEFNAAADRRAVDEVLGADVGVRVVPIEVTVQVPFGDEDVARWRGRSLVAGLCADLVERRRSGGGDPVLLHDPIAVVAAAAPELFVWEDHALAGRPDGSLVPAGDGRREVAVAVAVDVPGVRERVVAGVLAADGPA